MEEELTCAICSEMYTARGHDPVALPACGHTFCRQCLNIMEYDNILECPTCRTRHQGPSVRHLPTLFALLNLSEGYRKTKKSGCEFHGSQVDFWCEDCGHPVCGYCLLEGPHVRQGHNVLKARAFVDERKKHIQTIANHLLQEVGQKKEEIFGSIIRQVTQLAMGAQESEALSISSHNAQKIMRESLKSFDIESVLLSSTLMESLQNEVNQLLLVTEEGAVGGRCGYISNTGSSMTSGSGGSGSSNSGEDDGNVESNCVNDGNNDGCVDSNGSEGRVRCKSSGEVEAIRIEVDRQASVSEVEWVEEMEQEQQQQPNTVGEQQQQPDTLGEQASQEEDQIIPETAAGTNQENNAVSVSMPTVESAEQLAEDEGENPGIDPPPQEEGYDSEDQLIDSPAHQPQPSISQLKPWPLHCCVINPEGRTGRLKWEMGRMHMYAFSSPWDNEAHIMVQMSLLQSFMSVESPEVFLDLSVEDRRLGRVYIELHGQLRRAQHFLALCMGSLGPSYRGSSFHGVAKRGCPGETLAGGRYLTPEGETSVQALMTDLEWGGKYIRDKTEGLIVGASGGSPERDAFFHICTQGHEGKRFACAFGRVVSGLEVVQAAVKHTSTSNVLIQEVGVVIPLSHKR